MTGHVHLGIQELAAFTFMLLIVGFLLRTFAARFADSPIGKAVAYIY